MFSEESPTMADQKAGSAQTRRGSKRTRSLSPTFQVGRVRCFLRGKIWYIRYHEKGKRIQQRVGPVRGETKQLAAEINSQVVCGIPSAVGFEQIRFDLLRRRWLDHHEDIKRSSLATIARYRSATEHLLQFADSNAIRFPSDCTSAVVEQFVCSGTAGKGFGATY
jgi:hypothetical protein